MTLTDLPVELINCIAGNLDWKDYCSLRETRKEIKEALDEGICFPNEVFVIRDIWQLLELPFKNYKKLQIGFELVGGLGDLNNYQVPATGTVLTEEELKLQELHRRVSDLQDIWMIDQGTCDEDLEVLVQHCKFIHSICLSYTSISEKGLKMFCEKFTDLHFINLIGAEVGDEGLEHIANNCKNLGELWIGKDPSFSSWGVKRIVESCKNLQVLYMYDVDLDESYLMSIATYCRNLRRLHLSNVNLLKEFLHLILKNNKNIRRLYLSEFALTDDTAKVIGENLKKLRSLDISDNGITDVGIKYIAEGCKEMYNLVIQGNEFGDDSIKYIIDNCKKINILNLSTSQIGVTEAGAAHIKSDTLEHLQVNDLHLTEASIRMILTNCKYMKSIQMQSQEDVPSYDLESLKKDYPDVEFN